jgi:hypothetical protein
MRLVEIIPKWWEGRLKENDELWYIWYIVRTFVNVTIYPQHNNKKIKLKKRRTGGGGERVEEETLQVKEESSKKSKK